MIDFHTHILPGIDDGSKDMDMTERMLEAEMLQGVSHIFATPHFYAHRRSVESFLKRRNHAFEKVNRLLDQRPELPKVIPGAEVYYFAGMGRADSLSRLCVQDTDILLLEMPFDQWNSDMLKDLEDILEKQKLRIVLAHLERYERLQKDKSVWRKVLELPLTIQLNCESFSDKGPLFRKNHTQRFCFEMIKNHDNCIIGSDCHDLTDRKPNIAKARDVIADKVGSEKLAQIDMYTEGLLLK